MARRPSVRYWASRNGYCCWFQGRQHVLAEGPDDFPSGPTYQQALRSFGELTALASADTAKDRNTCRVICERYLQFISTRRKIRTFKIRQAVFVPFTDALGEVMVKDVTHAMVYAWLDRMREWRINAGTKLRTRWTDGGVRTACSSIQAAFNWASRSGLITRNPLTGMEQPPARSRGRHALLGSTLRERRANHLRILEAASRAIRPFLICLEATGCRPGELAAATAADFDQELGAIVYHADDKRMEHEFSHKTGQKGKQRVIVLTGEALAIVRRLVQEYPTGPLFRTGMSRTKRENLGPCGWTNKSIIRSFSNIRKKVGIPRLTAYSYRHTFATSWLEEGRSVDILAELLGNSPEVIRKHYSHLLGDKGNLRKQLIAFRASWEGGTQSQLEKDCAADVG